MLSDLSTDEESVSGEVFELKSTPESKVGIEEKRTGADAMQFGASIILSKGAN